MMTNNLLNHNAIDRTALALSDMERVIALGPKGTYIDGLARLMNFGLPVEYNDTFTEMAQRATELSRTLAMLAINNTMDLFSIHESIGLIHGLRPRIIGALEIDVVSNILGIGSLDDADKIASKDVAIRQITQFMPHLKRINMSSTAAAGALIRSTNDKSMLAIGSKLQAETYGLDVLAEAVQDPVGINITTVLLATARNGWVFDPKEIEDKSELYGTMTFRTSESDKPRSLEHGIIELGEREINLTNLIAFSIRGTRKYEFFGTFEANGAAIKDLTTSKEVAKNMNIDMFGVHDRPKIYSSDDPRTLRHL